MGARAPDIPAARLGPLGAPPSAWVLAPHTPRYLPHGPSSFSVADRVVFVGHPSAGGEGLVQLRAAAERAEPWRLRRHDRRCSHLPALSVPASPHPSLQGGWAASGVKQAGAGRRPGRQWDLSGGPVCVSEGRCSEGVGSGLGDRPASRTWPCCAEGQACTSGGPSPACPGRSGSQSPSARLA